MQASAKVMTNIALIRDFQRREQHEVGEQRSQPRDAPVAPSPLPANAQNEPAILFRDRTQRLIEVWRAPVLSEEQIETWAKLYQMCPKSGMSFVEYMIARGVGTIA